ALAGGDPDPHDGRYVERFSFGAQNGLDMCERLRQISVTLAGGPSAAAAHYKRGATPVNVAYGLALPGRFGAGGGTNRFDGANANNDPEMEAPDREHSADYDDYVLTRDIASLMTTFGCQPVRYHAQANYTQTISTGGGLDTTIGGWIMGTFGDGVTPEEAGSDLNVSLDREGIAVPALESVQSVALAYGIAGEIEGQYADLQDAVQETIVFASLQATIAALGVLVSTLTIVADGIGIAEAVGVAIACIGLCANEYIAIGLYIASIGTSVAALVVNVSATAVLVGAAIDASVIAARLNLDVSEEMDDICKSVELEEIEENEDMIRARERLADVLQNAKDEMDEAREELDDYEGTLETPLKTCNDVLAHTGNSGLGCSSGGTEALCSNSSGGAYCANAKNSVCFAVGNPSTKDRYALFVNPAEDDGGIKALYRELLEAERKYSEFDKKIEALDKKIEKTDINDSDVQDAINKYAEQSCKNAPNPNCKDIRRDQMTKQYQAQHDKAVADKAALVAGKVDAKAKLVEERAKVADAHELKTVSVVSNKPCPDDSSVTIRCEKAYTDACDTASSRLMKKFRDSIYDPDTDCSLGVNEGQCESYHWYIKWGQYALKKEKYDEAKKAYDKASEPLPSFDCAMGVGDGKVVIWTSEAAGEIVRRVDKRSLLQ
ncbi:MAG: hypothetical protein LBQ62_03215, partial [Candidatus Accumulibacter sp.]|nr:hypothetical protein [Accumulibacter sp.]